MALSKFYPWYATCSKLFVFTLMKTALDCCLWQERLPPWVFLTWLNMWRSFSSPQKELHRGKITKLFHCTKTFFAHWPFILVLLKSCVSQWVWRLLSVRTWHTVKRLKELENELTGWTFGWKGHLQTFVYVFFLFFSPQGSLTQKQWATFMTIFSPVP